jgi:hypothetical protein
MAFDFIKEKGNYDNRKDLLIHYLKELNNSNKPVTFSDLLTHNMPGGGISEFESAMTELEAKGLILKTEQDGRPIPELPFHRTIDRRFSITMEGVEYLASLGIIEDKHKITKKETQNHNIVNHGNLVFGDNPQGVIQGSDLGNSRFNNNSTNLETNIASEQPTQEAMTINKKEEFIWNKIYRWTDHKTISIIIGAILGFLGSKILKYFDLF